MISVYSDKWELFEFHKYQIERYWFLNKVAGIATTGV
jgi:hypothetical protein